MLKYIAADGLGKLNSSDNYLSLPNTPLYRESTDNHSVFLNLASGNLVIKTPECKLSAIGLPISTTGYYNSQVQERHWRLFETEKLKLTETNAQVQNPDGSYYSFTKISDDEYQSYDGHDGLIKLVRVEVGENWCMEHVRKGEKKYFDSETGLIRTLEKEKNVSIRYEYDEKNRLKEIIHQNGQRINVEWDEANHCTKLLANGQLFATYSCDEQNRLEDIQYFDGNETTPIFSTKYTYHPDTSQILSISHSDETSLEVTYGNGRVKTLQSGSALQSIEYTNTGTRISQGDEEKWIFEISEETSKIEKFIKTSEGHEALTEHYQYETKHGYIERITHADGTASSREYDQLGCLKKHTTADDEKSIEYQRNEAGQVTSEETSDTKTSSVTRYFYRDSLYHPSYKISGEGRVTEYTYDYHSQKMSERRYSQRLNQENDLTVELLAQWCLSQKSNSSLITYEYDNKGDLITTKKYSETEQNGEGQKPQTINQASDQFGKTTRMDTALKDGRLESKHYQHDSLGREISETDFYGNRTTVAHKGKKRIIEGPRGLIIIQTLNRSGKLEKEGFFDKTQNNQILSETNYIYDSNNRLVCKQSYDAIDKKAKYEYTRYDEYGRAWITYDSEGYATRHDRDKQGNIIKTTAYYTKQINQIENLITIEEINELELKTDINDRITYHHYDKLGRLRFTLDSMGYLTENRYNHLDQLTHQIEYSQALDQKINKDTLTSESLSNHIQSLHSNKNRITRLIYDADGLEIIRVNPNGGVIHSHRDGFGNIITRVSYDQTIAVSLAENANSAEEILNELQETELTRKETFIYNKRNELTHQTDAEGYTTEYIRDERGDAVEIRKYESKGKPNPDTYHQKTMKSYDADHREIESVDYLNNKKTTIYDYFDEPLAEYCSSKDFYINEREQPEESIQYRGYFTRKDCRGNIISRLDSIGVDNYIKSNKNEDAWNNYSSTLEHNGFGHKKSETNNLGHKTSFTTNARGETESITRPLGDKTGYVYNAFGEKEIEKLFYGQGEEQNNYCAISKWEYDTRGCLSSLTDPDGYRFEYNSNAYKERIYEKAVLSNGAALETKTEYDNAGNPVLQTQSSNNNDRVVYVKTYDAFNNLRKELTGEKHQIEHKYDKRNNLRETSVDNTVEDTFEHDAYNRITKHKEGEEFSYDFEYSKTENIITETASSKSSPPRSKKTKRNAFSEIIEVNHSDKTFEEKHYNPSGQIERSCNNSLDCFESNEYDKNGQLECYTNKNGAFIQFVYDKNGRQSFQIIHISETEKHVYKTQYDSRNLVIGELIYHVTIKDDKQKDIKLIKININQYTTGGDLRESIEDVAHINRNRQLPAPISKRTLYTYDSLGNLLQTSLINQDGQTELTTQQIIDDFGRVVGEIVDPLGLNISNQTKLDAENAISSKVDGMGYSTYYFYANNKKTKLTLTPIGSLILECFDSHQNLTKKHLFSKSLSNDQMDEIIHHSLSINMIIEKYQSDEDQIHLYEYNVDNQQIKYTNPLGHTVVSHYENGLKTTETEGDRVTRYFYDKYGHLAYILDPENCLTRSVYDKNNNLLFQAKYAQKVNPSSELSLELIDKLLPNLSSIHDRFTLYSHDSANRESFTITANGVVTEKTFNIFDQIIEQRIHEKRFSFPPQFTSLPHHTVLAYSESISEILSDSYTKPRLSESYSSNDIVESNVYDNLDNLLAHTDPQGRTESWTYNLSSQETSHTDKAGNTSHKTHDTAGRCVETISPEHEYFEIDQSAGAIKSRQSSTVYTLFSYNNNNMLNERIEAAGTQDERKTTYEYDQINRQHTESLHHVPVYEPLNDPEPAQTKRVEVIKDLTTTTDHDVFNNVIKRTTADGSVTYSKFNKLNKIVRTTDPNSHRTEHEYDNYGNETQVTRYHLPQAHIDQTVTSDQDRTIKSTYDKVNNKLTITGPVGLYHDPEAKEHDERYFMCGETTEHAYNAFSEVILTKYLMNPYEKRYLQERFYRNNMGGIVAELNTRNFLTVYENFDAFNNWQTKFEFSQALPDGLIFDDLSPPVSPVYNSQTDRKTTRLFNSSNLLQSETLHDISAHEPNYDVPDSVTFTPAQYSRSTYRFYDANDLQSGSQLSVNGTPVQATCVVYGPTRMPIFELQTPRQVLLEDTGEQKILSPVIFYGVDALDRPALVERSDMQVEVSGFSFAELQSTSTEIIPRILSARENNTPYRSYLDTICYGKNDLTLLSRQSNGLVTYYSHTAVSQIAKSWFEDSYYELSNNTPIRQSEQHTTLNGYDRVGNQTSKTLLDKNTSVHEDFTYNAFNEIKTHQTTHGGLLAPYFSPDNSVSTADSQEYYLYHPSGAVEKTNAQTGVWRLNHLDMRQRVVTEYRSQEHNLSQEKYTPHYLINHQDEGIQKTSLLYDNSDNIIRQTTPSFSDTENPLFTAVFVGKPFNPAHRTVLGDYAAIWSKPTSFDAKSHFTIRRKDSETWLTLPVQDLGSDFGVGLNHLDCDIYDYKLQFFHITDNVQFNQLPFASGIGVLNIINNRLDNPQHLVLSMIDRTRILATGKTIDNQQGALTGLEILREGEHVANVGVLPIPDGTYEANLEHLPSGQYEVRRADITRPIGEIFSPMGMNTSSSSRESSGAIYTIVSAGVDISITREVTLDYDTDPDPELPLPQTLNYIYTYRMRVSIKITDTSPIPSASASSYTIDIQNRSGFITQITGVTSQAQDTQDLLIFETHVPFDEDHTSEQIDAQVDFPVSVQNVKIQVVNQHQFKRGASLEVYNNKPSYSIKMGEHTRQAETTTNAQAQKTLHVDRRSFQNRHSEESEILAIQLTSSSNDSVNLPSKSNDHDQLTFDLSNIDYDTFTCRLMGANDAHEPPASKHKNETTYVDIDQQILPIQPEYKVIEDQLVDTIIEVDLWNVNLTTHYDTAPGVLLQNEKYLSMNGKNIEIFYETELFNGQSFSTKSMGIALMSVTSPGLNDWNHFCGKTHYVNQTLRGGSATRSPSWNQCISSITNVKIVDRTRNLVLYNNKPTVFLRLDLKNNPLDVPTVTLQHNPKLILYHFRTNIPLADDIISVSITKHGKYIGAIPIERPGVDSIFYTCNLSHLGLENKEGLGFQFLSANLINNYLIENPKVKLSTGLYQQLVVDELSLQPTLQHMNSMYWKKYTRWEFFVKIPYYKWAGNNYTDSFLHTSRALQTLDKRIKLNYVLRSKSGNESHKPSTFQSVKPYTNYFRTQIESPHIDDLDIPAQLVAITNYTVEVLIEGEYIKLFEGPSSSTQLYLQIKPLPSEAQGIEFYYKMHLSNTDNHWVQATSDQIKYQKNGVALIDSTGFPIAHYQYKIRAFDGNGKVLDLTAMAQRQIDAEGFAHGDFTITRETNQVVQVPHPDLSSENTITPSTASSYDSRNNLTSEVDALGHETKHEYNKDNQIIKTIKPKTTVVIPEDRMPNNLTSTTTMQASMLEEVQPTQSEFYSVTGNHIGSQDANGNVTATEYNYDNQVRREFWAYGVKKSYRQGIFGDLIFTVDEQGIGTRYINNGQGVPLEIIRIKNNESRTEVQDLNYRNQVIAHKKPSGALSLARFNGLGFVTHSVDPDGIPMMRLFDIQGRKLLEQFADGTYNAYYRGQFGQLIRQRDRAGINTNYQYDYGMYLVESRGENQSQRPRGLYDMNITLPTAHQNLYYYGNGLPHMTYSTPYGEGGMTPDHSILLYRYNANLKQTAERFWMNGVVYKDMVVDYRPTGDLYFISDKDFKLIYHSDPQSNIRALEFIATDSTLPNQTPEQNLLWFTFHPANLVNAARCLRNHNGQLLLSSRYNSAQASYINGNLSQQLYFDEDKNCFVNESLSRNNHGQVDKITRDDGTETRLGYTTDGAIKSSTLTELRQGERVTVESDNYGLSPGGALLTHHHCEADQSSILKDVFRLNQNSKNDRDATGLIKHSQQEIYPHKNKDGDLIPRMTNDYYYQHANFTTPVETQVTVQSYFHKAEEYSTNQSNMYLDENGVHRKYVDHNNINNSQRFISMPTKDIISQEKGAPGSSPSAKTITKTSSFDGRIIAQYRREAGENISAWEFESSNQPFSETYQASTPITIEVIESGTTFEHLAKRYYGGHAEYASLIQAANPGYGIKDILPMGLKITIPYGRRNNYLTTQSSQSISRAGTTNGLLPSIASPHIKMPKAEPNFMLFVPMTIGTVVSIVMAPYLTKFFGSQMIGMMAAGAAGGLAAEATSTSLGLSNNIDWSQVATATVAGAVAGLAEGIYAGSQFEKMGKLGKTLKSMHQTVLINVTQQGYLISTGQQEKFNWNGLVSQTVIASAKGFNLGAGSNQSNFNLNRHIKEVTEILLTQVLTEEIRTMMEKDSFKTNNVVMNSMNQAALYGVSTLATAYTQKLLAKQMQKTRTQPPSPQTPQQPSPASAPRRRSEDEFGPNAPSSQSAPNQVSHFSFEKEKLILQRAKAEGMSPQDLKKLEDKLLLEKYLDFQSKIIMPYATDSKIEYSTRNLIVQRLLEAYVYGSKQAGFANWLPTGTHTQTKSMPTQKPVSNQYKTYTPKHSHSLTKDEAINLGFDTADEISSLLKNNPAYQSVSKGVNSFTKPASIAYSFSTYMKNPDVAQEPLLQKMDCATFATAVDTTVSNVLKGSVYTGTATLVAFVPLVGPAAAPFVGAGAVLLTSRMVHEAGAAGGKAAQKACHRMYQGSGGDRPKL